jgi:hypothetical protein
LIGRARAGACAPHMHGHADSGRSYSRPDKREQWRHVPSPGTKGMPHERKLQGSQDRLCGRSPASQVWYSYIHVGPRRPVTNRREYRRRWWSRYGPPCDASCNSARQDHGRSVRRDLAIQNPAKFRTGGPSPSGMAFADRAPVRHLPHSWNFRRAPDVLRTATNRPALRPECREPVVLRPRQDSASA